MSISRKTKHVHRAARAACESLEFRRMLFAIDGTSGPDSISLGISGNDIIFVVNGVSDSRSDLLHTQVEINGLGGGDTITIVETGNNQVTVNGGDGNDTINLGLGNHDLDDIDDFVTVNGDANTDTLNLFDENQTTQVNFTLTAGNQILRTGVPAMVANVDDVVINGGSGTSTNLIVNAPPTSDVTFHGDNSTGDALSVNASGGQAVTLRPDDTTANAGVVTFSSSPITFTGFTVVDVDGSSNATYLTPNVNDTISVNSPSGVLHVDGSSDGINLPAMNVSNAGTFTLDTATNDAGAGDDNITASNGPGSVGTFRLSAGTGNNTFNVISGTWSMTTQVQAIGGSNVRMNVAGASTAVTLLGTQLLKRLQIDQGATVSFGTTAGNVLFTTELAVVSGTGNISLANGQTATVSTSLFTIGSGSTLAKKGAGTLVINSPQSHSTGAVLDVRNGTMNVNTDCGSVSSRTLRAEVAAGVLNFGATQHLASLSTTAGFVNLLSNGDRVIVTNFIGLGGEGGAINLNDNDLILDYTGTTELENVRLIIAAGHDGGAWSGIGLNSATAAANPAHNTGLGYAEATDLFTTFPATFSGQQIDNTSVLVKYTYYGDSNLSGNVDLIDFNKVAANFGQSNKRWVQGDSDYNLTVNLIDFNRLASAFGQSGLGPQTVFNSGSNARSIADSILEESAM